ncbi:hypothetical protein PENTCL1PPCAC_15354, partial [Pristionchus entomophagus]
ISELAKESRQEFMHFPLRDPRSDRSFLKGAYTARRRCRHSQHLDHERPQSTDLRDIDAVEEALDLRDSGAGCDRRPENHQTRSDRY